MLEAVFLIARIPAWSPNLTQREIRAPKIFITDPGLACHLRELGDSGVTNPELVAASDGPVIEGFVAMELLRQTAWSDIHIRLSHYRDRDSTEVDLIVEGRGRICAIEVKAGNGSDKSAVRNLARLRDHLGERFAAGVVMHTGGSASQLGDRLYGLPISALWEL
ncbi:MAG: DUF4143 domain-containing protein [Pseudonocardia sp.]|nr:DUF4143 domain-containing protein [Pseudonocardia sp.]